MSAQKRMIKTLFLDATDVRDEHEDGGKISYASVDTGFSVQGRSVTEL